MDRGAEVRRWRTALHLIHCVPYNNMKGGAGFFLFCRTRRWTGRAPVQSTNARWRLTRSFPSGAKSRERRTRRTSTAACIGCHLHVLQSPRSRRCASAAETKLGIADLSDSRWCRRGVCRCHRLEQSDVSVDAVRAEAIICCFICVAG